MPKSTISRNSLYYFIIAGFCSLLDIGVLYALTEWSGLFYLLSATLGFIVAQGLNYYLNKTFNFRDKSKKIAKQLAMFVAINAIGLVIGLLILAALVETLGMWYIPARIIGMLVAFNFNYFFHRKYTFVIFD